MKLVDLLISAALKKGILYEACNVDVTLNVPIDSDGTKEKIEVIFKCDHMTLKLDKGDV